jgi:hypothetical protein
MTARESYLEQLKDMAHADLLNAYARAVLANKYGSHDDEIKDVRSAILRRMTHEAI